MLPAGRSAAGRAVMGRAVVFGGTGFVGRRVVEALSGRGMDVRVAVRHPERLALPKAGSGSVEAVQADVSELASTAAALGRHADAVVNCVGFYVETRHASFQDVHVRGAGNVAAAAAVAKVGALVHISGIGADAASASPFVASRGEGEQAVQEEFASATVLRPSVMFGPGDAMLCGIAGVAAATPVLPLFGSGATRLQPVFVDDVAQAVAQAIALPQARGRIYELGGPEVLTYRAIVERVLDWTGRKRLLMPFPFAGWSLLAAVSGLLPSPPIAEGQVALMRHDNIADGRLPGLGDLGVVATPMADVAPGYLTST